MVKPMQIETKPVQFQSDSLTLQGSLVYPLPKNGYFGLLCLHGGSLTSDNRFSQMQEFLAKHGYSSLHFHVRGIGPSEGKVEEATLNNRVRDAQSALKFFRESGVVDREHIAVAGGSMGAHVAVRLAEKEKKIKTILLHSPAAYTGEAEDKPLNEEFTRIITRPDSWMDSPVWSILARFPGAVQVVYGTEDTEIPQGVKDRYRQVIEKKGRYLEVKNGKHKLLVPTNAAEEKAREELFAASLSFLNTGFR